MSVVVRKMPKGVVEMPVGVGTHVELRSTVWSSWYALLIELKCIIDWVKMHYYSNQNVLLVEWRCHYLIGSRSTVWPSEDATISQAKMYYWSSGDVTIWSNRNELFGRVKIILK